MNLYECRWGDQDDFIPDVSLTMIGILVELLPDDGFDVVNSYANNGTVQATIKFDTRDPELALRQFETILHAATVTRTLHNNLVAAREALADAQS